MIAAGYPLGYPATINQPNRKDETMELTFKAKIYQGQILPSYSVRDVVDAPKEWKRSHVSEAGKASPYINTNMLSTVVQRELKRAGFNRRIDVDNPPDGVQVQKHGPIAVVTLKV